MTPASSAARVPTTGLGLSDALLLPAPSAPNSATTPASLSLEMTVLLGATIQTIVDLPTRLAFRGAPDLTAGLPPPPPPMADIDDPLVPADVDGVPFAPDDDDHLADDAAPIEEPAHVDEPVRRRRRQPVPASQLRRSPRLAAQQQTLRRSARLATGQEQTRVCYKQFFSLRPTYQE
eukprot:Sro792_g203070.1 n/a (177) ;mRNA; r:14414-14944